MSKLKNSLQILLPESLKWLLKRTILRIQYHGQKFYCPVCRSNTNKQFPLGLDLPVLEEKEIIGAGLREALCPVCDSSDRIRLLYLFLKHRTGLFTDPHHLLHIAPEPSLQRILKKKKNIRYLTADIDPEGVMEVMDITRIHYPDNNFDALICNHVLEHIVDDRQAMKELFRVLKPGGWAVLQVPLSVVLSTTFEDKTVTTEEERERIFGQKDHVRIYGLDYIDRLKTAGFKVDVFKWNEDSLSEFHDPRININPEEAIFYCSKPQAEK